MPNFAALRRCAAVVAIAIVMVVGAQVSFAQTYPSRVIKIIVPFAVGGQPDTVARVFAQHLGDST